MGNIDISHLTMLQTAVVIAVAVLADFVTGIYSALASGTFKWVLLDQFIVTHLLHKAVPIMLLFVLSTQLSQFGPVLTATLTVYLINTLGSLIDNVNTTSVATAQAKTPAA